MELYTQAAEQGNATAQNNLGTMYDLGLGVKQDKAKAVELYTKAAHQGLAVGSIQSSNEVSGWRGSIQRSRSCSQMAQKSSTTRKRKR